MLGPPHATAAGSHSGAPPPPPPPIPAMDSSWIMNGEGLVKKIRNPTQLLVLRFCELVAKASIKCTNCEYGIDISNVSVVWPAFPPGFKFDPSDLEILQYLQGKSSLPNPMSHTLIDTFIPTIEKLGGICYTHPKNLYGVKMDGSSLHFFSRVSNAYGCGQRKRRKISGDENFRWHKTGASKAICDENGVHKGWKKILVLHKGSKKPGGKIVKDNWVIHQYHLGEDQNETDGEFVVSKLFYQLPPKNNAKPKKGGAIVKSAAKIDPRTPKTDPPQPRRLNNSPCNTEQYDYDPNQVDQEEEDCGTSIYRAKVEPAECSALSAESPLPVMHVDLPSTDEHMQAMDDPDADNEAAVPVDGSNADLFDGLPDLDTLPFL